MHTDKPPRVNIILSTHNGERFLAEQLDSLFNQTYPDIAIHIRDDGSADHTVDLVAARSACDVPVTLVAGDRIGAVPSFLQLLANSGTPGDLYAFCDQDDVWNPDKISRAVTRIMNRPEPESVLYCSRMEYVDEHLQHLGFSPLPRLAGFGNAVVENIATGCTVVFGETIRQAILAGDPDDMIMHDWWAYLAASAFGDVVYDPWPSVRYRRHGKAVTPWEPGRRKLQARMNALVGRLRRREHGGLDSLNQAIRFLETYPDTPGPAIRVVNTLVELRERGTIRHRIRYLMHPEVLRTDPLENIALKTMLLLRLH